MNFRKRIKQTVTNGSLSKTYCSDVSHIRAVNPTINNLLQGRAIKKVYGTHTSDVWFQSQEDALKYLSIIAT